MPIFQRHVFRLPVIAPTAVTSPPGVISPDGLLAAVVRDGPGHRSLVHLIKLVTGADRALPASASESGAPGDGASALAWSPGTRWLFTVTANGAVIAITATGQSRSCGVVLPSVTPLAIRAGPGGPTGHRQMARRPGDGRLPLPCGEPLASWKATQIDHSARCWSTTLVSSGPSTAGGHRSRRLVASTGGQSARASVLPGGLAGHARPGPWTDSQRLRRSRFRGDPDGLGLRGEHDRAGPAQREPRRRDAQARCGGLRHQSWPGPHQLCRRRCCPAAYPASSSGSATPSRNEQDVSADVAATVVVYLASGAADVLSGRIIDVSADVARVVARAADINERDLYVLRARDDGQRHGLSASSDAEREARGDGGGQADRCRPAHAVAG
jgi:hypothetical protein